MSKKSVQDVIDAAAAQTKKEAIKNTIKIVALHAIVPVACVAAVVIMEKMKDDK